MIAELLDTLEPYVGHADRAMRRVLLDGEPIGLQVEAAATFAEEATSPFALLLSREDVQW